MTPSVRNKLALLGAVEGLTLALPAALLMASRPSALVLMAVACALVCGAFGALLAGARASRGRGTGSGRARASRGRGTGSGRARAAVVSGLGTGLVQGLYCGLAAAALFWVVMTVVITELSLGRPVEPAVFTQPGVLLGSFFVALSAFAYALVGCLLLGPIFGVLVNRISRGEARRQEVGADAR